MCRKYLVKSLQIAWEAQIPDNTLNALFYFAMLLVKESVAISVPDSVKSRYTARALELLALIIHHPAAWQAIKDRATSLKVELEAALPADLVTIVKAQRQAKSLEAVVLEILAGDASLINPSPGLHLNT
jgi:hypothetical protein